jgi:hypothetical protein
VVVVPPLVVKTDETRTDGDGETVSTVPYESIIVTGDGLAMNEVGALEMMVPDWVRTGRVVAAVSTVVVEPPGVTTVIVFGLGR